MEQLTEFVSKSFNAKQLSQLNLNCENDHNLCIQSSSSFKYSNFPFLKATNSNLACIMNGINGISHFSSFNLFNPAFHTAQKLMRIDMTAPPSSSPDFQKSSESALSIDNQEVNELVKSNDYKGKINKID